MDGERAFFIEKNCYCKWEKHNFEMSVLHHCPSQQMMSHRGPPDRGLTARIAAKIYFFEREVPRDMTFADFCLTVRPSKTLAKRPPHFRMVLRYCHPMKRKS
jgi:hypothetical protein